MTDQLNRFLFEERAIRGEIVTLTNSYQQVLASISYPAAVKQLIGELMAATSLLTATLKFEGEIALQIQSEGHIKYAVVNATHEQNLRGVARWDESLDGPEMEKLDSLDNNFSSLFHKGLLAITITPKDGKRYQGIVGLDKASLSLCLEEYFLQSEQLLTKVWLATDTSSTPKAGGMLLQIVPTSSETSNVSASPDFEHVSHLANTLSSKELFSVSHKEIIKRLYHEDDIRMFTPQTVQFFCDCSKERSATALMNIDKQELLQMIEEDGDIKMDCQFCHAKYVFDKIDVENLHSQNLDSGHA